LVIRRALLIANPASRRGQALTRRATNAFEERGVHCDLWLTERAGHAGELATMHGPKYDAVFSLGGDGTAMEVVSAAVGTGQSVGVLPGGTGNLLARALEIPLDVRRAVFALLDGGEAEIDLGRLETGHHFAIAAGIGIDAAMVVETSAWAKRHFGILAYVFVAVRSALRMLLRGRLMRVRVTIDGETTEYTAAAVMVANFGALLSNRFTLGTGIVSNDGVLDVCAFTPRSVLDTLRIVRRMMMRDFSPSPVMHYRRGQAIRVETDRPVPAQADGELIGHTPFAVTVVPRCVRLLIPAKSPSRV
jgi:diacylglycerol kinase (ATP)